MKSFRLSLALAAAAAFSAAGCGRPEPAPAPAPSTGAPAAQEALPPAAGTVATSPDFPVLPPDVPVFPGARAADGRSDSGPTGAAYTATFEANADAAALLDWYRARLESAGWTAGASLPATGGGAAFFSKEKRTLLVRTAAVSQGVATVTLQESDLTDAAPATGAPPPAG